MRNRGEESGLYFYIKTDVSLRIAITNETVDFTQHQGEIIPSGKIQHEFIIGKQTLKKQEKPYSDCLNGLDSIDSYDSELFKRTLTSYKQRYHYSNCVNLCRQKNLGEKCHIQAYWLGHIYFDNMKKPDYYPLLNGEGEYNESKCYQLNFVPSDDFLKKCDCPVECRTDEYTSVYSFGEILNPKFKNGPMWEQSYKAFYSVNFTQHNFFKHFDWLKFFSIQSKCLIELCSVKCMRQNIGPVPGLFLFFVTNYFGYFCAKTGCKFLSNQIKVAHL